MPGTQPHQQRTDSFQLVVSESHHFPREPGLVSELEIIELEVDEYFEFSVELLTIQSSE